MLGLGRLLADTQLSPEQQQYVQMINNSGRLLLTIINDILDFSKIEAGQLALTFAPHNISDVVESSIMLIYETASSKGLQLVWFVDPALPPSIMLDATRLQQILLNLLSNAIKFTKSGSVELEVTGFVQPPPTGTAPDGSSEGASASAPVPPPPRVHLRCSVRDTGIGISPGGLSKLFKSFSQVHQAAGEFGGTGLGLVISKRLVEAMGHGTIEVSSELGRGSTFACNIVADVAEPQPSPEPVTAMPPPPALSTLGHTPATCPVRAPAAAALNVHGVSEVDRATLSRLRLLHICTPDSAVHRAWALVAEFYQIQERVCATVAEARQYLLQLQQSIDQSRNASGSAPDGPLADASCAADLPLLLIDLDCSGVASEQECISQLCTVAPLRMIFLDSHSKNSSRLASASSNGATAMPLLEPVPLSIAPLLSSALRSVPGRGGLHADTSLPAPSSSPSVSYTPLRRVIRKPFKTRTLLRTLVAIMQAPLPQTIKPALDRPAVTAGGFNSDPQPRGGGGSIRGSLEPRTPLSVSAPSSPATPVVASHLCDRVCQSSAPQRWRILPLAAKCPLRILLAEVRPHTHTRTCACNPTAQPPAGRATHSSSITVHSLCVCVCCVCRTT